MYGSIKDALKDLPDAGTSWLRYMTALTRSLNREGTEFLDSYLIAAQIALQAAKDNPMTLRDTMEIMQHKSALMGKGMRATQEKMTDFMFDQMKEANEALFNTVLNNEEENIAGYLKREAEVMEAVANFPEKIEKVKTISAFISTRRRIG